MSEYDSLEEVGAIVSGLGLLLLVATGSVGLGLLIIVVGFLLWKMGETRRTLKDRIEEIGEELETLRRKVEGLEGVGGREVNG